ncbi:DUF397 domain-containing protein [Streptomyces sp. NBC_01433]|uniref:DUF397 domain-containing protein n=1 Tax=Streptomyces sp. NBC_01433 TaxID=2903864 RepID=UPI00225074AC|nr:DUF397 domain-containing protein [Streptomyces sp. NBC_01433]MCX4675259.1 DUF397 domain-containing protein [Streptomyces sp. NBC_01433]
MRPSSSDHDLSTATWHRSSYCGASGGNCLEVGFWQPSPRSAGDGEGDCEGKDAGGSDGPDALPRLVPVRDSKRADGPAILFRAGAWEPFLSNVKRA